MIGPDLVIGGRGRSTLRLSRVTTATGVLSGSVLVAVAAILGVAAAVADPLADAVFERIAERLAMMKPVAAWKRDHGVTVEDRAREAIVLESAIEQAAKAGLAVETARPFFEAQIAAAKPFWCAIKQIRGRGAPEEAVPRGSDLPKQ